MLVSYFICCPLDNCIKTSSLHFIGLDSKFLGRLARKFGDQQYQLGVDLRVKTAALKRILQENDDAVTGTLKILQNWKDTSERRSDLSTMFDELCSTLSELDNNDLVEFVRSGEWT